MSKFKTVTSRIELIKTLIGVNNITPLLELEENENHLLQHNDHECSKVIENGSNMCTDSKCILGKKLVSFRQIITKMDAVIEYIKSGTTGHTFKGTVENGNSPVQFAMKIVPYPIKEKYGDIFDIRRPENAELAIIKLLSWFVVMKQSPHIVLPFGTFNIDLKKFIKLTKNKIKGNEKFDTFVKKCENNDYYPIASVLIGEWADGGDLLDFLKKNYKQMELIHWQVLFFQIIATLAIIQEVYPSFRHNDLKANNILVSLIGTGGRVRQVMNYHIKNQYFMLPNVGFMIKLWDFDFACIAGLADNAKVNADWTKDINIKAAKNRYYDLHYFFNTLTKKVFFPKIFTASEIPVEVGEFIRRVVPKKYVSSKKVTEKGRILVDDEYVLPIDLILRDDFFSCLRRTNDEMQLEYKKIKKYKMRENSSEKNISSEINSGEQCIIDQNNKLDVVDI
jgi:hypothetical protein